LATPKAVGAGLHLHDADTVLAAGLVAMVGVPSANVLADVLTLEQQPLIRAKTSAEYLEDV
jgi:hypothetical protein